MDFFFTGELLQDDLFMEQTHIDDQLFKGFFYRLEAYPGDITKQNLYSIDSLLDLPIF